MVLSVFIPAYLWRYLFPFSPCPPCPPEMLPLRRHQFPNDAQKGDIPNYSNKCTPMKNDHYGRRPHLRRPHLRLLFSICANLWIPLFAPQIKSHGFLISRFTIPAAFSSSGIVSRSASQRILCPPT